MEKTVFLFKRKDGWNREDFGKHYIGNHAPLGKKLTFCLKGYTVNLIESESEYDSVTEHWVENAMDLLTRETSYATVEDAQAVWTDDRSFLHEDKPLYVVVAEREVVAADPLDAPLGEATPEIKAIWFYANADAVPPPPSGARRVVDSTVGYFLRHTSGGWEKLPSDIAIMRSAWAGDLAALGADAANALIVREYRQIAAAPVSAASAR